MSNNGLSGTLRLDEALHAFSVPTADTPFWEHPPCPIELMALLFPDHPPGARLYFLADATLRRASKGTSDLDVVSNDLPARSLFLPRDEDDPVTDYAPWLLDLTAARTDRAAARFLQDLFTTQWQAGTGLLMVSCAGFDDLFAHLRRLTRPECDWRADRLYFRFWDPAVFVPYLRAIADRPNRLRQLLMLRDGTPLHLVAAAGAGKAVALSPVCDVDPASLPPPAPLKLDKDDLRALSAAMLETLERQLGRWLAASHPERFGQMPDDRMQAAGRHVVQVGQNLGFTEKDDFAYLAHMMSSLGGFFHQSGIPETSLAILSDPQPKRHLRLQDIFMTDYLSTPQGCVALHRPTILADLAAMPDAPYVTFEAMKGLLERRFSGHRATTGRFLQAVWAAHDADAVPDDMQVAVSLLSLFFGLRFYDDPFHDPRDPALVGPARIADAVIRSWARLMSETHEARPKPVLT